MGWAWFRPLCSFILGKEVVNGTEQQWSVWLKSGIILQNQAGKRDLRDLAVVATEDLSEVGAALLELTSTHSWAGTSSPTENTFFVCVYHFALTFLTPPLSYSSVVLPVSCYQIELNIPSINAAPPLECYPNAWYRESLPPRK